MDLMRLADLVAALTECGTVVPSQQLLSLAAGRRAAYIVTRTAERFMPRSLVQGSISARHWRALHCIAGRQAAMSAARCLRDGLSVSDQTAAALVQQLARARYIAATQSGGWEVSATGYEALR